MATAPSLEIKKHTFYRFLSTINNKTFTCYFCSKHILIPYKLPHRVCFRTKYAKYEQKIIRVSNVGVQEKVPTRDICRGNAYTHNRRADTLFTLPHLLYRNYLIKRYITVNTYFPSFRIFVNKFC